MWQSEGQTVIAPFKRGNEFHFRPTRRINTKKMNGNYILWYLCVFSCLNRDWKGSPLLSKERGRVGLHGGEPVQAAVQSFRWATNGSVSHHFSILAAEKLFLPLVWWRPPFIWCNWEAKRSSVASAISQPPPLFCWDTCLLLPQTLPAAPRNRVSWSRVPNCWCVPSCNFSLSTFPFTCCLVFCLASSLLLLPHPGPPFFSSSPTFHNLRLATLSS